MTFLLFLRRVIMNGAKESKKVTAGLSKKPPAGKTTRSQTRSQSTTTGTSLRSTVKKSTSDSKLNKDFSKLSISQSPTTPARSASSLSDYSKKGAATGARSVSTFSVQSLEDITDLIKQGKCHRIVVMAGAGISTPSGIPDFRTPGSGLYDNLQKYNVPEPTDIFDINYFWYDPQPFFCLARTLYPGNFQPNYVHYFIRHIFDKGLLHRMYTQNIDGLERLAGIPSVKLIEAHGTFSTASCVSCKQHHNGEDTRKKIMKGETPRCLINGCLGVVKPDIVFFGENLPKRFYSFHDDIPHCDLLLVMGTSLEVEPFASIAREVNRGTPRILFNREVVGPFKAKRRRDNDVVCKGDIVKSLKKFADMLGWSEEIDQLILEENKIWTEKYGQKKDDEHVEDESKDSGQAENANNSVETGHTENSNTKPKAGTEGIAPPSNRRTLHTQAQSNAGTQENHNSKVHISTTPQADDQLHARAQARAKIPTFTLRSNGPALPGKNNTTSLGRSDFKAIDPMQDLASAGFGLGKRTTLRSAASAARKEREKATRGAKFLMGDTDSSEDTSDSETASVSTEGNH